MSVDLPQLAFPEIIAPEVDDDLVSSWEPPVRGPEGYCPIVVLCDAPTLEAYRKGIPLHPRHHNWFGKIAKKHGFVLGDMKLVGLCSPISKADMSSDKRMWEHVEKFAPKVRAKIAELQPKTLVVFGKLAARVATGRAVKITKVRGVPQPRDDGPDIFPMLSPGHVRRLPENVPSFDADVATLSRIKEAGYDVGAFAQDLGDYQWVDDLPTWLAVNGRREGFEGATVMAVDTETQGGTRWWDPDVKLLSAQICWKPGLGLVVPVCDDWCGYAHGAGNYEANRRELKRILEDGRVRKVGHNLKFEHMMLRKVGIEVQGWLHDTQLMLFNVDENLQDKSLDNGVRVFVPEMGGYCVVPETKILTADMRWQEAGSIEVGNDLVGFDEYPPGHRKRRKMRSSKVEAARRLRKKCFKVTTRSGRQITVSDNHMFLVGPQGRSGGRFSWVRADALKPGRILKTFPMEERATSFDAGWLSGIIDGEGWLSGQGTSGNPLRLGWSQKPGLVLGRSKAIARNLGLSFNVTKENRVPQVCLRPWEAIRALQMLQPTRLTAGRQWEGCPLPVENGQGHDIIVSVEDAGTREVVALTTSTHTFVAEGICSHNCDELEQNHDKSNMAEVPRDRYVTYSGGDADATLRLARRVKPLLDQDERQRRCYRNIQMPGILSFANTIEPHGMLVNTDKLRNFAASLDAELAELYRSVIARVPAAIKQKHLALPNQKNKKPENILSFTRDDFTRDILFSKEGFGLKPRAWTDSTAELPDGQKVPSVSSKKHLPYFTGDHRRIAGSNSTVGDFVADLIQLQKGLKLKTTYVGLPARTVTNEVRGQEHRIDLPATGIWQYLSPQSRIYPSYMLHRTNTGRTACVHEDTIIPTKKGPKRIIDVVPGDMVWTHAGRWRRVIRRWLKPVQEMYDVHFTNGEILTCTEDHRIMTQDQRWVSVRDVCLQETLQRSERPDERGAPLSRILADHEGRRRGTEDWSCDGQRDSQSRVNGGRVQEVEGFEVLGFERGEPQSHEGKETGQLQRQMPRWARVLDRGGPWQEVFRASDRHGRDDRYSRGGLTGQPRRASHRRESDEQRARQPSIGHDAGTRGSSREVQEVGAGIRIARVEPRGSYPVHDLEVEEDHSYECAGGFSHNSADPNGQNFPNKGNWAKQYKEIFEAAPGWVLVSCDLSQIELRLVAWMSRDPEMLRIYNEGGDIHVMTASRVLGVSYEEMRSWKGDQRLLVDCANEIKGSGDYLSKLSGEKRRTATVGEYYNQKRFGAKAINFGFIYGMSAGGFQIYAKTEYGIDYTFEECLEIRLNFFDSYRLKPWHDTMHAFAEENGYVRALHGAIRRLPSIYSEDEAIRALARRQAVNAPIQRLGSDLGIIAQGRFCRQAPTDIIKVNGFIHDALYMEVREDFAHEAASALKWVMETPPLQEWFGLNPPLPLLSEAEIGGEEVEVPAVKPDWWNDDESAARAAYLATNRSDMLRLAA